MKRFWNKNPVSFILLAILFLLIAVIVFITNQESKLWTLNTWSLIGSLASIFGLLIVIKQLIDLSEQTDEISKTYATAVYNLVYNEVIQKLSKGLDTIESTKQMFMENRIKDTGESFDQLFDLLSSLDQISTVPGFENKIDNSLLQPHIGFCQEMISSIYAGTDLAKDLNTDEFNKLYELQVFLKKTNNNLRVK
jgi:hypothetical protein